MNNNSFVIYIYFIINIEYISQYVCYRNDITFTLYILYTHVIMINYSFTFITSYAYKNTKIKVWYFTFLYKSLYNFTNLFNKVS